METPFVCVTVSGFHCPNLLQCLQCSLSYCQSCIWGCPRCGWGKDQDRRWEARKPLAGGAEIINMEEET